MAAMPEDCVELPLPGGQLICVPPSSGLLTTFVLREQQDWFEPEIRFVRRLLQPGEHVVDIGANHGTYTLAMAAAVGSTGSVQSFEPASAPRRLLLRSLERNRLPWVTVHAKALSNRSGEAEMTVGANSELNSLTGTEGAKERIQLSTLDEALAAHPARISFVKMDAEGEEERILEASTRFFAAHDPLVMFELKHGFENNDGLSEAFLRRGFLIKRLVPGLGVLAPIPLGEAFDGYLLNAFAARPAVEAELERRGLLMPVRPLPAERLPPVQVQAVIGELAQAPWIRGCGPQWGPDAGTLGWDEHRRAVALGWVALVRTGLAPVERWSCLRHALAAERRALSAAVNGSRLFTFARLALALGQRAEAVGVLQQVAGPSLEGQDQRPQFREPFLLPMPEHEALELSGLRDLIAVAAVEGYLWNAAHSAYFTAQQRPLYQRLVALPGCSERSRRALALLDELARGPRR